jgi:hypothetical protein
VVASRKVVIGRPSAVTTWFGAVATKPRTDSESFMVFSLFDRPVWAVERVSTTSAGVNRVSPNLGRDAEIRFLWRSVHRRRNAAARLLR